MVGILETDFRSVKRFGDRSSRYGRAMPTQAERRATTRGSIVGTARDLFIRDGYDETSIADILEATSLSRGAVYHHFDSKQSIFEAVFVETSADAIRRSGERIRVGASPLDRLIEGCLGWLQIAAEPEIARILFVEGPSAIGWERCRALEEATSLGVVRRGIGDAMEHAVEQERQSVVAMTVAARLLNALLAEAALSLQATSSTRERKEAEAMITATIRAMIPSLLESLTSASV